MTKKANETIESTIFDPKIDAFMQKEVSLRVYVIISFILIPLLLGMALGYNAGRDTVKMSYKYVNYCDQELSQNYTSYEQPTYNIAEFADELQEVELPFFMWVIVILILVVILK